MSFLGKAVKKVFNFGKKIVKGIGHAFQNKWVRAAFITALAVFTIGAGSAGYAGFGNLMATAQASGASTLGSFFSAVGSTLATGYGTISSSVGSMFGAGTAASQGMTGELPTGNVETPSPITYVTGGSPAPGSSTLGNAITGGGAGYLNYMNQQNQQPITGTPQTFGQRLMGSLFGNTYGSQFMRSAVIGGFMYWAKQREYNDEKKRKNKATVYGGRAFGSPAALPEGFIRKPYLGDETDQSVAQSQAQAPQQRYAPTPRTPTLAAPLQGKATNIQDMGLLATGQ